MNLEWRWIGAKTDAGAAPRALRERLLSAENSPKKTNGCGNGGGGQGGTVGGSTPCPQLKYFFKGEKDEEGFQVILNFFSKSYVLEHSECVYRI